MFSLATCDTHTRYTNSPSAFDALILSYEEDRGRNTTTRGTNNEGSSHERLGTGDMAMQKMSP